MLPTDKAEVVQRLQGRGAKVAFVGDAASTTALAQADVGIAIGTGTDIAIESADVVLMSGDVMGVPRAIALSQAVIANIRQNLAWAFGYNALLIPVAAGVAGLRHPALAGLRRARHGAVEKSRRGQQCAAVEAFSGSGFARTGGLK